ncbi:MAG: hypothetical protein U5N55_10710 [Cypionkella sp.]|nr:hypothetical protein [Cypionkella sp.]
MAITVDWAARQVIATSSITDIVDHHDDLRAFEESAEGMMYPPIITYKVLDLGGGASFIGLAYINGYQLIFPNAGNYTILGNIEADVIPVAGVFVDRTKSAAFATVSGSGGGDTWETVLEGTYTAAELMRIMASVLAGKVSGMDANAPVFRSVGDTADRVSAVTTSDGNRTSVTVSP